MTLDRAARRHLLWGAACWLFAALMVLAWAGGHVEALDARIAGAMVATTEAAAPLATMLRAVTAIGDWEVRLAVVAAFVLYLAVRRFARAASYVIYATLGCWMLVGWGLKPLIARARPGTTGDFVEVSTMWSMPSAHAANTAAIATAIAIVGGVLWWRRRHAVRAIAAVIVIAVGCSRILLGVHWPSDVLAGWAIGAGWALLLAALIRPVVTRGTMEQRESTVGSAPQRIHPRRSTP